MIHEFRSAASCGLILGIGALLLSAGRAQAATRSHRINLGLSPALTSFEKAQVTPDGKWVVWVQKSSSTHLEQLHAARRWEGSVPIALSPVLPGSNAIYQFEIAPDNRRLVYVVWGAEAEEGVWSTPIDGSSPPLRLSPMVAWNPGDVRMRAIGDRAVFVGEYRLDGLRELWSAPLDGSAPAIRLHGDPAAGGGLAPEPPIEGSVADGRVLFLADLEGDLDQDLWIVPPDGSAPPVKLDPEPGGDGDVEPYGVFYTIDGSRVLFFESMDDWGWAPRTLWSVPVDGSSPPTLISGPSGNWPRIGKLLFDPDGQRVRFTADSDGDQRGELWVSPVAGPASQAIRLAEATVVNGDVAELGHYVSESGTHIVFLADLVANGVEEIWTVPVDSSEPPARRSPEPPAGGGELDGVLLYSEGMELAGFFGPYLGGEFAELWSVPIDSPEAPTRLDTAPVDGGVVGAAPTYDGRLLVFVTLRDWSFYDLWSVERDGSAPPLSLYAESVPGSGVWRLWVSPSGRWAVFNKLVYATTPQELWGVPLAGQDPEVFRIHPDSVSGANTGFLRYSFDGHAALFAGDFDTTPDSELWIADWMIFRADFEGEDLSEWSTSAP